MWLEFIWHNYYIRSTSGFRAIQILFSRTVMQMIWAWPKIWTLSGRLSLMRTVQVKIKWHIKRKYLIQKFHNICLSYYFKIYKCFLYQIGSWIVLYSNYPKIWTLSGRLSLMRTVQLMKKMLDASKNIFCVYHIRIIAPKKNGSHNMKQTDSSIIIVRNVCVLY
jgi:hypothetical protein